MNNKKNISKSELPAQTQENRKPKPIRYEVKSTTKKRKKVSRTSSKKKNRNMQPLSKISQDNTKRIYSESVPVPSRRNILRATPNSIDLSAAKEKSSRDKTENTEAKINKRPERTMNFFRKTILATTENINKLYQFQQKHQQKEDIQSDEQNEESDRNMFGKTNEDDPEFDSSMSDYKPSPDMLVRNRRLSNPFLNNPANTFERKNDAFNAHILNIAKMNRLKAKADTKRIQMTEREANSYIIKKVNMLRYRENIFRAVSKLSAAEPPFPKWSYKDKPEMQLDIITFNVGGKRFETFDDTIMNLPNTKLSDCFVDHASGTVLFFDRDSQCFKSVLNFYRTGKLHSPSQTCLSFFESELQFWGINEDLMEPCCYSDYKSSKEASNNLKRYMDSRDKFSLKDDNRLNLQERIFAVTTLQDKSIFGMWYQNLCGVMIICSIISMIFSTSQSGRQYKFDESGDLFNNKTDNNPIINGSVTQYFQETTTTNTIKTFEVISIGFFTADILGRFIFCSNRLVFFSDFVNWIDIFATFSSLVAIMPIKQSENFELMSIMMKVPRIFRLFRLTKNLRCGMDALSMTLECSANELKLFCLITIIAAILFGSLLFVVELIDRGKDSSVLNIFIGMWWALVTMSTTGYGDIVPTTGPGFIVGFFCILVGIIITQLPVPIFLRNFSLYYNQIHARLEQMNVEYKGNVDPEIFAEINVAVPQTRLGDSLRGEDLIKLKTIMSVDTRMQSSSNRNS